FAAVGRAPTSTAKASSRSSPNEAARAYPYAAAIPIAGAPRTARSRIASATSAAEPQASSTSSSGSRRWSSRTTRSSSSRRIRSGSSTRIPADLRRDLGSFVPGGEVARLLLGQLVDVDPHRRELETGDLLVDLLGHRIDAPLEARRVRDHVLGRERLVRERHIHHLGRVALRGSKVDQPPVGDQVDPAAVRERELVDELAQLTGPGREPAQRRDVDLDVEVARVREHRAVLHTLHVLAGDDRLV